MTGLTWVAWRHQRWVLISAVALIAVWAALLAWDQPPAGDFSTSTQSLLSQAGIFTRPGVFLPVGVGLFWGAPLLAREWQRGTIDLAYTQSVSRSRWLTIRIVPTLLIALATTCAVLAVEHQAVAGWAADPANGYYRRLLDVLGPVLFEVALGILAGALLRRAVPAMAVAAGGYAIAVIFLVGVGRRLVPVRHAVVTMGSRQYQELTDGRNAFFGDMGSRPGHLVTVDYYTPGMVWAAQLIDFAVFATLAAVFLGITYYWMTKREARS